VGDGVYFRWGGVYFRGEVVGGVTNYGVGIKLANPALKN